MQHPNQNDQVQQTFVSLQDALDDMKYNGVKYRHKSFSKEAGEFIKYDGLMVELTEGYKVELEHFMLYRQEESWQHGWQRVS